MSTVRLLFFCLTLKDQSKANSPPELTYINFRGDLRWEVLPDSTLMSSDLAENFFTRFTRTTLSKNSRSSFGRTQMGRRVIANPSWPSRHRRSFFLLALTIERATFVNPLSGDDRDRTDNPRLAKPVLSQLSYVPLGRRERGEREANAISKRSLFSLLFPLH